MLTTINTRWEAAQRVMAAKITRLTHKIVIQLHLVPEICTIFTSRSRRPVRKLLDTLLHVPETKGNCSPYLHLEGKRSKLHCRTFPSGSSVSIVTRLRDGRLGFDYRQRQGFFTSPPLPDRLWGQPSLLSNGFRDYFPRSKAVGSWSWPLTLIYGRS
jgi:hypothetical protein